jgi:hypothetical protein
LNGLFSGTDLVWARARFHQPVVQVNKFVKLSVEVFSKLTTPMKVSAVEIKLNTKILDVRVNYEKDQPFLLCKSNPMRIERDIILDEEESHIGFIMLNEIGIELQQLSSDNQLRFSVSPYLAPAPTLIETANVRIKRLPPPITCQIEPLPHKIKLVHGKTLSQDQALVGDAFKVNIGIETDPDILLKSLKA